MEYEIKPAGRFSFNLPELWEYRELVYFFTWRDIKIKYKQTLLGAVWAVIQPVLLMLIFTVFFARNFNIPSSDLPYPVFVYAGLLLWNLFAAGVQNAGNGLVANANMIKKIYFPRLIIPLSSVLSAMVDFVISLAVYGAVLIYYHLVDRLPLFLLALPLSIIITLITALGVGSLLSALNVKYRDFRYVIPFMIQILMFLTPVIYPVSIVHIKWIQTILVLNPMAGAIDLIRASIALTPVNFNEVAISLTVSVLLLITGLIYFRKTEYYFADLA